MKRCVILAALLMVAGPAVATAALYSENFDVDPTANWTVNRSHDNAVAPSDADFYFDYSTVGIPSAPGSGGTTLGLRLRANRPGGTGNVFSGISVSPAGKSFSGSYTLEFDAWLNSIGPFPGGGTGSTQVTSWGVMTDGTTAQWAGGTQRSVHFGATAEGGATYDYRAYSSAAISGYAADSGVYAAGTASTSRNDTNAYYAGIGGKTPPAAQTALYPSQTGTTSTGSAGMAWRHMVVTVDDTAKTVAWTMDGLLIATVSGTDTLTLGGGNILFGQYDINGTTTTAGNGDAMLFGLIDNVVVTPEPTSLLLLAGGMLALRARRRR